MRATPASAGRGSRSGDLSRRLEPGHRVVADLAGEELVEALTAQPASEYLVVEANGDVFGVLAAADVERALTA